MKKAGRVSGSSKRKAAGKVAGTYGAHRERQRRRILDAAWKLMGASGVDRVTMAEITVASGVRASTVYQYFANKDAVVWAMAGEVMQAGSGHAWELSDGTMTGLARISALLESMAEELTRHPERVRFMAQFDALYARRWPVERLLALESEIFPGSFRWFGELIEAGMKDGSLRGDLDPDLTLHAVMNAVIGTQRRLASLGSKVETEYGQTVERMFRETIRVLLAGLSEPEKRRPASARKKLNGSTGEARTGKTSRVEKRKRCDEEFGLG